MKKKLFFKSGKVKLCGILSVPKKVSFKGFCMVFCHGWTSNKDSKKIQVLQNRLAKKGLASFALDFYGHGESQGNIQDITQTIAVNNIGDAISFLRKKGFGKFGLYGSSFGGGTAIAYAARYDRLEFLCLLSPVTKWDYNRYVIWNKKYAIKKSFWNDAKKYNFFELATKIKVKTLLVQGDRDKSTPLHGAKKLFKNLKGGKVMIIAPGVDHYFRNPKPFKDAMNVFSNFIFSNTLKK